MSRRPQSCHTSHPIRNRHPSSNPHSQPLFTSSIPSHPIPVSHPQSHPIPSHPDPHVAKQHLEPRLGSAPLPPPLPPLRLPPPAPPPPPPPPPPPHSLMAGLLLFEKQNLEVPAVPRPQESVQPVAAQAAPFLRGPLPLLPAMLRVFALLVAPWLCSGLLTTPRPVLRGAGAGSGRSPAWLPFGGSARRPEVSSQ